MKSSWLFHFVEEDKYNLVVYFVQHYDTNGKHAVFDILKTKGFSLIFLDLGFSLIILGLIFLDLLYLWGK